MPGLAPAGDLLFFASPKKPKEKKGDPQSGPLRGSLKKLKEPENLETSLLRSRQTSKFFNPSLSTFSSPARTGWGKVRIRGCPNPNPPPLGEGRGEGLPDPVSEFIPNPVLTGLEKAGGDGLKNLDGRRQRSWLVSRFSGSFSFFKEPRSGPDCGSLFFSLGFFGEAKKSKSPAGASPGTLKEVNRY